MTTSTNFGQVTFQLKGTFLGYGCCPDFSIGFSTDLVTIAKTIFDNVLVKPIKALFSGKEYHSLADFAVVDDPVCHSN